LVENRFLSFAIGCARCSLRIGLPLAALITTPGIEHAAAALNTPALSCPINPVKARLRVEMNGVIASDEVHLVADWVMRNNMHKSNPFIVADKAGGLLFAFDANGGLLAKTPALFGATPSDALTEEQAGKMMDDVVEADKITPAGIFTAEAYNSPSYGKAVRFARYANSNLLIHRAPNQQRLKRLQTSSTSDNRITYGCINALPEFVDQVLLPYFSGESTVFVLPEMQSAKAFFAINDAAGSPTQAEIAAAGESFISAFLRRAGEYTPRDDAVRHNPSRTPGKPDKPTPAPAGAAELKVDLRKKIA
jgi:hypothetical protein